MKRTCDTGSYESLGSGDARSSAMPAPLSPAPQVTDSTMPRMVTQSPVEEPILPPATLEADLESHGEPAAVPREASAAVRNTTDAVQDKNKDTIPDMTRPSAAPGHPGHADSFSVMNSASCKEITQINQTADCSEREGKQIHAVVQYNLGTVYQSGFGVAQDLARAKEWFEQSANQGNADAQNKLGRMYRDGKGVDQDLARAKEWFEQSANQGNVHAQFNLGRMYETGLGIAQDLARAKEWFEQAANQGNADAQNNLGCMYQDGEGVDQDLARAKEWFEQAANQGNVHAQNNLGYMYRDGEGVKKDLARAKEWFEQAAKQGLGDAQDHLSDIYQTGLGVPKNVEQATYWRLKFCLDLDGRKIVTSMSSELLACLPDVFQKYTDLQEVRELELVDFYKNQAEIGVLDQLIRSNTLLESITVNLTGSDAEFSDAEISDEVKNLCTTLHEHNVHLTKLKFHGVVLDQAVATQLEQLQDQNLAIRELREYLMEHPPVSSDELPLEVLTLLADRLIILDLKRGMTREATKQAVDTLLLNAEGRSLQAVSGF